MDGGPEIRGRQIETHLERGRETKQGKGQFYGLCWPKNSRLRESTDGGKARVLLEYRWYYDRSIRLLPVLEQGGNDTGERQGTPVQGVHKGRFFLAFRFVADVHAPCLE